jgi:23S rRNA pseudouridine955/2504/2580 synthase
LFCDKLQIDDVVRIPPIRVAESKLNKTSDSLKKLLTESILYEDKGLLVLSVVPQQIHQPF